MTLVVSLCLLAAAPRRAEAWETLHQAAAFANVTILPNGDVAAAGAAAVNDTSDWLVERFDGVSGAPLWTVTINGGSGAASTNDYALGIASDSNGDVLVGGVIMAPDDSGYRIGIVKLNGLTGDQLWGTLTTASYTGAVVVYDSRALLVVDASGNPVLPLPSADNIFRVIKLDGTDGHTLWEYTPAASTGFGNARGVALDGLGDVVAIGSLNAGTDGSHFAAVKLSGATGAEIWQQKLAAGTANGSNFPAMVALEPNGDVIEGGTIHHPEINDGLSYATVVRLAAADGAVLWVSELLPNMDVSDNLSALAVNASGRIFAGYRDYSNFTMDAVDPTDGSIIWSKNSSTQCGGFYFDGTPFVARTLSNGDVVASGSIDSEDYIGCGGGYTDVLAIRYSAVDGTEMWRTRQRYFDSGWTGMAIAADDDVFVAGGLDTDQPPYTAGGAVVRIDGTDGQFVIATPTPTPTITASPTPTTTPTPPALVGYLECYGAKDPSAKTKYDLDVLSGYANLPNELGCTFKSGAKDLCVEVTTQNVDPPPGGSGPALPPNSGSVFVSYKVKCPTKATLSGITLQDQFDGGGTFKPSSPSRLLVPAFPGPANGDHIECFKAKDTPFGADIPYTMDLISGVNGFSNGTGCQIVNGKAKEICMRVTTQNVTPAPPYDGPGPGSGLGETFIAYKLKCPKTTAPQIYVEDHYTAILMGGTTSKTLLVPAQ